MKTLNLHCDYIKFKALKPAIKTIEEIFNEIFMQMVFYLPPHHDAELKNMSKKNKKLNSFRHKYTLYKYIKNEHATSKSTIDPKAE